MSVKLADLLDLEAGDRDLLSRALLASSSDIPFFLRMDRE